MTMDLTYGAQSIERRDDPSIRAFRHDRLGQFIHWGLYSIPAGEWDSVTHDFASEFLPKSAQVAPAEWEALAADFAATGFDADQWARTAIALGARYVTVTTKHHEGFCLWPSEHSDLTIAHTPFGRDGRDVIGELVDAYSRHGLAVHLYYSVLDWHHPDWRSVINSDDDEAAFQRYLAFATAQLRELASRYPEVRGFWFDGTWDESVRANGWWTLETEQLLKELIPGAIVNSRLRADDHGSRHFDSNGQLMGDYESGYERRLPEPWDTAVTEDDWEACATLGQWSWGHHASPAARATLKNPAEVVEIIAHATSLSGNVLVNFGPDGSGRFTDDEQRLAEEVGRWMDRNGVAIHGCGHAEGWTYPGWGHFTASPGNEVVYAIVTRPPVSGRIVLHLPRGTKLRSLTRPTAGQQVRYLVREQRQIAVDVDRATEMPEVFAIEVESAAPPAKVEDNPDLAE